MRTVFFLFALTVLVALLSGPSGASGAPTVAVKTDRDDSNVATSQPAKEDSRASVRETDPETNTASTKVIASDDESDPSVVTVPAANAQGGNAPANGPAEGAGSLDEHLDDGYSVGHGANAASEDDLENTGATPADDHEVEPEEEGTEDSDDAEHDDEDERDGEEEGGEEGDEEEEEGTEEDEEHDDHHVYAENDEEEFDDDPKTKSRGVSAKDFDWNARKAKVTPKERASPDELRGEHFDGDGNRDTKDLLRDGGNRVDELNKDIVTKMEDGKNELAKLRAKAADLRAENPDAANAQANGETPSKYSPSGRKHRRPRKTPGVRRELALQKAGTAKLPTAPRRPIPDVFSPSSGLKFDWRGSFDGHNFVKIPHSEAMSSKSFTVTFWMTLHPGNHTNAWRAVMHKGFTNFQRTPSLWLEYGSNRLYAAISTTYNSDETILSKTSLTPGIPAHIAYVVTGKKLELFIDGELEASKVLQGDVVSNTGPLYLGKDSFYTGVKADMHSFEWHMRPLGKREIRLNSQRTRESVVASFDRSGKFDGGSLSTLSFPHNEALSTGDFTVSFWVTLRSHGSGSSRSILHKGLDEEERTPYIALDKQRNRLDVRVSTTSHHNEGFLSQAELRLNQPTHIAYVRREKELSLYIDGVLDTQISTRGHTEFNEGAVFIGNSPFADGFDGEITGFRWSRRAFTDKEVLTVLEGSASPPLRIRSSSTFRKGDYIRVPHVPELMSSPDFSVSMWLRPSQGPTGKWRSIFHKGRNPRRRTPSLWFNPKSMQVTAEISLGRSLMRVMRLTSKKVVPVGKTTHVGMTLKDGTLCILIEGWIDSCRRIPSGSRVRPNKGVLMIGKSSRFPGFAGQISDFRYHNRALPRSEMSPYEMDIPEGVFAYWNPALGDHVLSLNKRVYGQGLHGYQIISSGEGIAKHGKGKGDPIGFAHNIAGKYLVPLYGFFNDRTGDHTYTTSANEARPGYEPIGVVMYVFPPSHHPDPTVVPIYEHFNAKLGDSYFTANRAPAHGYTYKKIAFFLHKDGKTAVPVREYYSPSTGGGATLEISAPVSFNGWDRMVTSDLGFLTPSKDFSIAFWLKLDGPAGGFYRTIMHHGSHGEQRSPAIYLMPHEPRLSIRMSTGVDFNNGFDSNTVLPIGQYSHIVLSSQGNILTLIINGKVDVAKAFIGHRSFNPGPFHIGRFPQSPGVEGTVGGFKFFDHITTASDAEKLMIGDTSKPEVSLSYISNVGKPFVVPHSEVFDSETFTIILDYVMLDKSKHAREIVWKGNNKDESTPSLSVTADGRLLARLSTSATRGKPDAHMISSTIIAPRRRYRIALIRDGDAVQLLINGKLDKSMTTQGAVLYNNGPLRLAGAPWAAGKHNCRILSFKWFGRALSLREIRQFSTDVDRRAVAKFDWRGRVGLGKHIVLPASPRFRVSGDFTMAMWLTTAYDTTSKWRFFALRGEAHFYRSPALQVFPKTGRVRATMHLRGSVGEYVSVESVSTVPFYTPTHVALVKTGPFVRLLIDGVSENSLHVANAMLPVVNDPVTLGNLNAHVAGFKWINRALMDDEILKEIYSSKS